MTELLACPFCGSADVTTGGVGDDSKWVMCTSCKGEGPWASAREQAISAWNHRAAPIDRPGADRAGLAGAVEDALDAWDRSELPMRRHTYPRVAAAIEMLRGAFEALSPKESR